jgi:adenylate cyclase
MASTLGETASRSGGARSRVLRLLRRDPIRALIGANLVAAVVILARSWGLLQPLELLVYDALRVAWAEHQPSPRILLIGGTEADIEHWDWPMRDGDLAALLERIAAWQPRVIGVDLYRDHPEPPGTDRLNAVLAHHKEIVWAFKLKGPTQPGVAPPAALRGSDRAVLADVVPDQGNIVRRGLLYADDGTDNYTGMGMALALGYLAADHIAPRPAPGDRLRLGKAVLAPLDDASGLYVRVDSRGWQMLLDYHGGPDPFALKSVGDIMHGDSAAALVRGRAVLVGITAESVKDYFATPFDTGFHNAPPIWGIALHAQVADQLIREAEGASPILTGWPRRFENLWIWCWAMAGAGLGMALRSTIPAVLGMSAGLVALVGIVYGVFGVGLLLPALPAAIAWIGAAGLANLLLHAASNRARAHLRRSFEHYLPPAVIARMIEAETLPKLGGERREISVVFTDVAGFTTFSESLDPEFLAALTNRYFDGVCAAIFAEGGLVNEFIGDGVLALFGAPHDQPDHADRAVSAAFGIDAFASRFSADQQARGIAFGATRIGIHTGVAMVGNVGTRSRLKYTALGDVLNTASRLEGLNKAIGTRICASGEIVAQSTRHRFRRVGAFVLKGRSEATEVFEPLRAEDCDADRVARYEAALRLLAQGEPAAAADFDALHREDPHDPCVAFHRRRLIDGESGTVIVMAEK